MHKVLIVTYYWPPAGGPGVQRVLSFTRYLPQYGWEPVILTVENGDYSSEDPSLIEQIPNNINVYKVPAREPFNLYRRLTGKNKGEKIPSHILGSQKNPSITERLARFIRLNFFIPDARIGWIQSLVKKGLEIIRDEKPHIILSSSPPHSLQLAVQKIARKTGITWVADFRDPWTDFFHYQEKGRLYPARFLDQLFERRVLKAVDAAVSVSPSVIKLLTAKFPQLKSIVIFNGFEHQKFETISSSSHTRFTVFYAGNMRKSQNPEPFLHALQSMIADGKDNISFRIAGSIHPDIQNILDTMALKDYCTFLGYLEHRDVIQEMINADLLLLLIPDTPKNEGIITGKLFEYIASGNPVLGLGPENGDAAAILNETKTGQMIDYRKDPGPVLELYYSKFLEKKEQKHTVLPDTVYKYSREMMTQTLAEYLDELA